VYYLATDSLSDHGPPKRLYVAVVVLLKIWAKKFLQISFLSLIFGVETVTTALRLFVEDYFGWLTDIMDAKNNTNMTRRHTHLENMGAVK